MFLPFILLQHSTIQIQHKIFFQRSSSNFSQMTFLTWKQWSVMPSNILLSVISQFNPHIMTKIIQWQASYCLGLFFNFFNWSWLLLSRGCLLLSRSWLCWSQSWLSLGWLSRSSNWLSLAWLWLNRSWLS